jgi:hypothetical protein
VPQTESESGLPDHSSWITARPERCEKTNGHARN